MGKNKYNTDTSLDTSFMGSKVEETLEVAAWAYIKLARNGYVFIKPRLQDDIKFLAKTADKFLQRFTRRIEKTNVEILDMLSDLVLKGLDNIHKLDFLSRPITSLKKEELHQSENLFWMLSVYCASIWSLLPDSAEKTKQGFLNLARGWFYAVYRCIHISKLEIPNQELIEEKVKGLRNRAADDLFSLAEKVTRKRYLPGESIAFYQKRQRGKKVIGTESESVLEEIIYEAALKQAVKEIKEGSPPNLENVANLGLLLRAIERDFINEIDKRTLEMEKLVSLDRPLTDEEQKTFLAMLKEDEQKSPEAIFEAQENAKLATEIRNLLNTSGIFTEKQKKVLLMRDEGFMLEKIAENLKISKPMVHKHLEAGKKKVKKILRSKSLF